MRYKICGVVLLLLVVGAIWYIVENAKESTVVLTDRNFDKTIKTNNIFVKFYTPW